MDEEVRNLTKRRQVILEAICASERPLSPPEIHSRIWDKNAVKKIAVVTVYRTLKLLVAEGVVRKIVLPTGDFLYGSRNQTSNPGYFLCTNCMGLSLLEIAPASDSLPPGYVLPEGFRVEFQEHFLFGFCKACSLIE